MDKQLSLKKTLILSILIIAISVGIRQSFGVFLKPITETLGISRSTYSLSIAIQNIMWGIPLLGILSDKFGARVILMFSSLMYSLALLVTSLFPSVESLFLFVGFLVGLAQSGTTYVVILGMIGKIAPPEKRVSSFGVITAAGSFGMFLMPILTQTMIDTFSWNVSLFTCGILSAVIIILSFLMEDERNTMTMNQEVHLPFSIVLYEALKDKSYWCLMIGYFVCGFHLAFIVVHLPAFLFDYSISSNVVAISLAMIGLFNIVGSYSYGRLGDRHSKKYLLSSIYFLRVVVIAGFVYFPISNVTAITFGCLIGLLWLATVPLTSGIVQILYGAKYASGLNAIVFFSHQVGAFIGLSFGGWAYNTYKSYDYVWVASMVLGIVATLAHLPIVEQRNQKVLQLA